MEQTGLIWIDGDLVPAESASVSVFDHGLVVGDGAFETLVVIDGTPFAATRHIRRLHTTLAALAVEAPSEQVLRQAMEQVVSANQVDRARLRLTVTGGLGPLGSGAPTGPVSIIAAIGPLAEPPTPAVVTAPWTRNEGGALAGLKTTSYAENVRALRWAKERGASEAIFANTKGELCEGTGTNVFVVVDGRVSTPPLRSGCLAGITRELVLEIAEVDEVDLPLDVLRTADEVFLTSTTRDVQGLTSVDDRALPVGPATDRVAAAFAELVRSGLDP
ncbi:MAG: aminotransferase class IV [Actinomycetota bacterium]